MFTPPEETMAQRGSLPSGRSFPGNRPAMPQSAYHSQNHPQNYSQNGYQQYTNGNLPLQPSQPFVNGSLPFQPSQPFMNGSLSPFQSNAVLYPTYPSQPLPQQPLLQSLPQQHLLPQQLSPQSLSPHLLSPQLLQSQSLPSQPPQYLTNGTTLFPSYDGAFDLQQTFPTEPFNQSNHTQQMPPTVRAYQHHASQGNAFQEDGFQGNAYQGVGYQGSAYRGNSYQGNAYKENTYQPAPPPHHVMQAVQSPPLSSPSESSPRMAQNRPGSHGGRPKPASGKVSRKSSSGAVAKPKVAAQSPPRKKIDSLSLLLGVAEDCLARASHAVENGSKSKSQCAVEEYHKLVATGLGCLDAVLRSGKLAPRAEAKIRLRYAGVLLDETENYEEAETTLSKGISLCERHRILDLKYCMEFLLIKGVFRQKEKAAMKVVDTKITECTTLKHIHWIYAFRFLKASLYLQSHPAEAGALENLRSMAELAKSREDKAICVMASLLEALTHLLTMKDDAVVGVQTCIADISKHQLDDSLRLPHIDVWVLLLDLACNLYQKSTTALKKKVIALQTKMGNLGSDVWDSLSAELLLPIKKQNTSSAWLSGDTSAILRQGKEDSDFLVLTTFGKSQAHAFACALTGQALVYAPAIAKWSKSATELWEEALRTLDQGELLRHQPGFSLQRALEQQQWESEFSCYLTISIALDAATSSKWSTVRRLMSRTNECDIQPRHGVLKLFTMYLSGVYYQGIGDMDAALRIFADPLFDLEACQTSTDLVPPGRWILCLLAALDRVLIMQLPERYDKPTMDRLMERIVEICEAPNCDTEVKLAYHAIMPGLKFETCIGMQEWKRHMTYSLNTAKTRRNGQLLLLAFMVLRHRLFSGVVGDQAVSCTEAALRQARAVNSQIWQSVGEGLMAETSEKGGFVTQAKAMREKGISFANEAYARTWEVLEDEIVVKGPDDEDDEEEDEGEGEEEDEDEEGEEDDEE